MYKLNPAVKAAWLVALRSGLYSQTNSVLKSTIGYCCLGVLCDVAIKEFGYEAHWDRSSSDHTFLLVEGVDINNSNPNNSVTQMPPADLKQLTEVPSSMEGYAVGWSQLSPETHIKIRKFHSDKGLAPLTTVGNLYLTVLNDDFRYPFDLIADIVEDAL